MDNLQSNFFPNTTQTEIALAFPSGKTQLPTSGTVLAVDLGGTKTELALFKVSKEGLLLLKHEHYPTKDHKAFISAIKDFHDNKTLRINCVCMGVAGTVVNNRVHGVNFGWEIDGERIKNDLDVDHVVLINDLKANAYGLATLQEKDFYTIYPGTPSKGNAAVISPGTGLGEAGMYWDGNFYHPYSTEGGHCNFAPTNELDVALWQFLHAKFGHVSWERLVSGQGIVNIFDFLTVSRHLDISPELTARFQSEDKASVISTLALAGINDVCTETLHLFFRYLATETAQLALKTKAIGGIYIGGGIVPKNKELLNNSVFFLNFSNVGRMESLLKTIPIKLILNDKTALLGAAYYAAMTI